MTAQIAGTLTWSTAEKPHWEVRSDKGSYVLLIDPGDRAVLEGGYAVKEAGTGRKALVKVVSTAYAAVVLNLRLREMSGPGLLKDIKALPGYRTVPVVVLAVGSDAALGRRAAEWENASCLCEPFGAEDLALPVDGLVVPHCHNNWVSL
ncbi:MAG: response regulator [Moorellaceae bacterium]